MSSLSFCRSMGRGEAAASASTYGKGVKCLNFTKLWKYDDPLLRLSSRVLINAEKGIHRFAEDPSLTLRMTERGAPLRSS
jgi:hypothetical protein